MFDPDPSELAVRGERGIDLFQRQGNVDQQRVRYYCVGTVQDTTDGPRVMDFEPHVGRNPATLMARAQATAADPALSQRLAFADTTTWPSARAASDPVVLFLHLDFFRAWQVADLAIQRLITQLAQDAQSLPTDPSRIAGGIMPVFDFNRLAAGQRLADLIEPVLRQRIAHPEFRDDPASSTGFALRMLGDLCLRAGNYPRAYACFETAIGAADNPYRRRKAIEAAHLAGNTDALRQQLDAFAAKWPLPDDLAALCDEANT